MAYRGNFVEQVVQEGGPVREGGLREGCEGIENGWDKFRSGAHPTRYDDRGGAVAPWRTVGKIFAMLRIGPARENL
jgi:hypothetical protein